MHRRWQFMLLRKDAVKFFGNPFARRVRANARSVGSLHALFLGLRFAGGANEIQREILHVSLLPPLDQQCWLIPDIPLPRP
jgi:hypothetical protein